LRKGGWKVRAAGLRGYDPPPQIADRIPDIFATKPGNTLIVEIETPQTESSHKGQIQTLRRHAAQKPNTEFRLVVTRPRKKR